ADAGSAAMNQAASAFAERGQQSLSQAAQVLSGRLGDLSGYLQTRSLDEIVAEARRMARENPALFIAGGVAAGLLLSRFFKASSGQAQGSTYGSEAEDATRRHEDQSMYEDRSRTYEGRRYSAPDPGDVGDSWGEEDPGTRGGLI